MNKNIIFSAVMVLMATLFIAVMPTEAEGAVYEDTVRLHILAESDSAEDQAVKIALRDAVLFEFGARLRAAECADNARAELLGTVGEIEDFCQAEIARLGYSGTVSVTLIDEWYETREYGDFTLPAGVYTSLKIVIGNGEGQNWWCVMYPPLCLDAALSESDAAYTKNEKQLVTKGGYRVKFKLLEVTSAIFESFSP